MLDSSGCEGDIRMEFWGRRAVGFLMEPHRKQFGVTQFFQCRMIWRDWTQLVTRRAVRRENLLQPVLEHRHLHVQFLKSAHLAICWRTVRMVEQCGNVQGLIGVVVGDGPWVSPLQVSACCRSRCRHLWAWSRSTRWWMIFRRWSLCGRDVGLGILLIDVSSSALIDEGVWGTNGRFEEAIGVEGYMDERMEPGSVLPSD